MSIQDQTPPANERQLGVTVMPEYVQNEGVRAVLANLCRRAGATSVTTSPYVAAISDAANGGREPPPDGGSGNARLLDRPLWGRRELYIATAPSFAPDLHRYTGLRYQPPQPTNLTAQEGGIISTFLDEAERSGMSTYLQIMAACPPALRVQFSGLQAEDRPLDPEGGWGPPRVDNNASLAASEPRRYMEALIGDLCAHYPQITGLKFDWPEIPPYDFHSLFFDFNDAVRPYAERCGIDFEALRTRARDIPRRLRSLGKAEAEGLIEKAESGVPASSILMGDDTLAELMKLRRFLVSDYQRFLVEAVRKASDGRIKVFFQGFPPPWNDLTGFDFAVAGKLAEEVGAKIYSMHWPLIEKNYCAALRNMTSLSEPTTIRLVRALLRTTREVAHDSSALAYPGPDIAHPADSAFIEEKLGNARAQSSPARFWGISHGYGPTDDVLRRFGAALRGARGIVQLNRYSYLTDEKLDAIGDLFASIR